MHLASIQNNLGPWKTLPMKLKTLLCNLYVHQKNIKKFQNVILVAEIMHAIVKPVQFLDRLATHVINLTTGQWFICHLDQNEAECIDIHTLSYQPLFKASASIQLGLIWQEVTYSELMYNNQGWE